MIKPVLYVTHELEISRSLSICMLTTLAFEGSYGLYTSSAVKNRDCARLLDSYSNILDGQSPTLLSLFNPGDSDAFYTYSQQGRLGIS
jgi:hypothetical protein